MMVVAPGRGGVEPLHVALRRLLTPLSLARLRRVHSGLAAKSVEFSVSYFVTGTVGIALANQIFNR